MTLIYMYDSPNLMMINTHFEKVQIRPSESVGVITVFSQDMTCPSRGCEPIVFDN